jgi:mRNA interferase MazF
VAYVGRINRWEFYWADLDPVVGSEQAGKRRPVLVVSNGGFNRAFDLVTIVPLTKLEGERRRVYSFEVVLPSGSIGNEWSSIVMPHQVRTISKLRLLERIGVLSDPLKQIEIENRLVEHLGVDFEPDLE